MGHLFDPDADEMDAGSGACLMVGMAALERVGFFDPRYFMFGEDVDLCYRLKLGGWKIFYQPAAGATHHVKPATPAAQRQMSYERYRSIGAYPFKHHAEDESAFGNGLVGSQVGGGWATERVLVTVSLA